MSIKAMNWAWSIQLAPSEKLLLLALADCADDLGICWPGMRLIAKKCNISTRTAQRTIGKLISMKLLSKESRFKGNGRQTSNSYRLMLSVSANRDNLTPYPKNEKQMPGERVTDVGMGEPVNYLTPLEPLHDPSLQPPLIYPPHLSQIEKSSIQKMLTSIPAVAAQQLLDELSAAIQTKTIKKTNLQWFRGLIHKFQKREFEPVAGVKLTEQRNNQIERAIAINPSRLAPTPNKELAELALMKAKSLLPRTRKS